MQLRTAILNVEIGEWKTNRQSTYWPFLVWSVFGTPIHKHTTVSHSQIFSPFLTCFPSPYTAILRSYSHHDVLYFSAISYRPHSEWTLPFLFEIAGRLTASLPPWFLNKTTDGLQSVHSTRFFLVNRQKQGFRFATKKRNVVTQNRRLYPYIGPNPWSALLSDCHRAE